MEYVLQHNIHKKYDIIWIFQFFFLPLPRLMIKNMIFYAEISTTY
jgi:hypothetical protein